MAIYHMSVQVISRGQGRSAVAAAAYRSAERIRDDRQGLTHDYSQKAGVEYSEILAPQNAPEWVHDRAKLWNEVDKSEKRINSRTAREIQLALPKEISNQSQERMLRDYAKQNFVSKGMIADISIHRDNPENPHAHIMLTTREIGPDGFGKKARDWNDRNLYRHFREEWARQANLMLAREGVDQRVDHRSYADQGIDLEPTKHLGFRADQVENDKRDLTQEKWEEHQRIIRRNAEAIRERPEIVLEAITHQKSTFTRSDVGRFLNTRTVDADQFRDCLEKVMNSEELVKVGRDEHGRDRFTTIEMLELEKSLVENSKEMHESDRHSVNLKHVLEAEKSRTLSSEQVSALHHITRESGDVSVIEGYAGAGKSYMLGTAREAWERQGYRVLGGALAGKAAEGLQESAQIESRSLHSWEYAWKKGTEKLTRRDVLVVDEAGMVGSRQMSRVIETARQSGAKIVLVGDLEQLQAIEAGAPMRAVAEVAGSLTMDDIRRQGQDWQREATQKLATGRTKEAIQDYESRNFVHEHETKVQAMTSMVESWNDHRKNNPEQSQIMLAFRRDEVRSLNEQARTLCQQDGKLGREFLVQTELGQREFAQGDRVYFLKNDFLLGVKNGTLGVIERMDEQTMTVRLDGKDGRRVNVDFSGYNHLDHGYAATVHKSQGVTVDRAHALAGSHYDRHVTYVAMSRHRDHFDLHWSREESKDRAKLLETLSRARLKDLAVDYQKVIEDNHELARQVKSEAEVMHGRRSEADGGLDTTSRLNERERGDEQARTDAQRESGQQRESAQEPGAALAENRNLGPESQQRDRPERSPDHGRADQAVGQVGQKPEERRDGSEKAVQLADDGPVRSHVADGRDADGHVPEQVGQQVSAGTDREGLERVGAVQKADRQLVDDELAATLGRGKGSDDRLAERQRDNTSTSPQSLGSEQASQEAKAKEVKKGIGEIAKELNERLERQERTKKIGQELKARLDQQEQQLKQRPTPEYVLQELREARKNYLEASKEASLEPLTKEQAFKKLPEVEKARSDQEFHAGHCKKWEEEIQQHKRENPVRGRLGLADDHGLRKAYRGQMQSLAKAEEKLERVLSDKTLHQKAEQISRERMERIEKGKQDKARLQPDYDRGQREIPEVVLDRYLKLEREAKRETTTINKVHEQQPEVEKAQTRLEIAQAQHGAARREVKQYEEKHPVKAKLGRGEIAQLREKEQQTKERLDRATERSERVWKDPALQKRSLEKAKEHNQKIEAAKRELKEIQPFYERAQQARECSNLKQVQKERDERLKDAVSGRDCAAEYKKKLEKYYMEKPNTKKADWRATKDLAKEGFSKDQLKAALKKESFVEPDLSKSEFDKYVDRTVEKAMKEPDVIEKRQEKDKSLEHDRGFGMDRGRGR